MTEERPPFQEVAPRVTEHCSVPGHIVWLTPATPTQPCLLSKLTVFRLSQGPWCWSRHWFGTCDCCRFLSRT